MTAPAATSPTLSARLGRLGCEDTRLKQWRCSHCGWRLFDANVRLADGEIISVRCRGCRRIVTFTAGPQVEDAS